MPRLAGDADGLRRGHLFSCVTKVKTPDGWDYRRVCVEGPVFDAAALAE